MDKLMTWLVALGVALGLAPRSVVEDRQMKEWLKAANAETQRVYDEAKKRYPVPMTPTLQGTPGRLLGPDRQARP